jgi:hypothetical protein
VPPDRVAGMMDSSKQDSPKPIVELRRREKDGKVVYEARGPLGDARPSWLLRVRAWLALAAGLGIGVCLFLFFLTVLVYVILPVTLILGLFAAYRYWRLRRALR